MDNLLRHIETPAILLDLNVLESNINRFHGMANRGISKLRLCHSGLDPESHSFLSNEKKEIWPMIKTHKATQIAQLQLEYGATGFLCGTLDECEALERAMEGTNIMYAYPVTSEPNLQRIIRKSKTTQ